MLKAPIAILLANSTLTGLVGENEASTKPKIYPVIAPQGEKHPYIVLRQTGGVNGAKNCGYMRQFAVTCYHQTFDGVVALDNAVISTLLAADGTYEGIEIAFINAVSLSMDDFSVDHNLYSKTSIFECQADA